MAASLRIGCAGCPADERDPRIHMISDRRKEKVRRHLSQLMVWLYCWLNLVEIIVANLLYTTVQMVPYLQTLRRQGERKNMFNFSDSDHMPVAFLVHFFCS